MKPRQVEMWELFQPSWFLHGSSEIPGLRLHQYRSVPLAQRPMPQTIFVSCPDYFRGTGKAQGSSLSQFKKKKKFSWTFIYIVTVNFPSSICESFFLFTWKGNTKIWLCTGGGRRLHFSSLSVRFGNFFSPTSESEPSSCCKLCSHPQNGTSQLEWTKVHRWVGEGQGTSARECLGWGG